MKQYKVAAFTLTELLVVLIIIGILVLVALPNLMPLISKAHSVEAQTQLNHLHALEKSHFYMHSVYTNDLELVGFQQETLVNNGGQAKYQVEVVESSSNSFLARATAVVDFDGDGIFNVWEINQDKQLVEVTKD